MRKTEEGVPEDEENFDEAVRAVNSSLTPTRVRLDILLVLWDQPLYVVDFLKRVSAHALRASLMWHLLIPLMNSINKT